MSFRNALDELFQFTGKVTNADLPIIFPMTLSQADFIENDVVAIYTKILTDTLERTHGLSEEQIPLMWDNCVKSSKADGLITMLAKAMARKAELYLVYDKAIGIVREADNVEREKIMADYKLKAESPAGAYISFKEYRRTDMVKLYSSFDYCIISALNKTLNISAAAQFKFKDLRASVSVTDSLKAENQAQAMAEALLAGKPIMMDGEDSVETGTPDLTATEKAIQFTTNKLAFYLGMNTAYMTGEQTGGIGSSGENDQRATERGLKAYFYSVLKPAVDELFDVDVSYKSQDFRNITGGLEVLKIFNITDDTLISAENKLKIINQVFDLPEDSVGDAPPPPPKVVAVPGVPPAKVPTE